MYSNIQDCDEGTKARMNVGQLADGLGQSSTFGNHYITSIGDMDFRRGRSLRCMPSAAGHILFCTCYQLGYLLFYLVRIKCVVVFSGHSETD